MEIDDVARGGTSVKTFHAPSQAEDITKTAGYLEAMENVKEGRVYKAASTDDLFKQILG